MAHYAARRSIYDIRGFLWQLDNNGEVISEPNWVPYRSATKKIKMTFPVTLMAVNNNGIAVGQSWTYHPERGAIRMPAIFENSEALPVTESADYFWGAATDINDNNKAIGYLAENRAGNLRNTAFVYDLEATDDEPLTLLPGFFSGSSTVAECH